MELPTKIVGLVGAGFTALATLYGGATYTHDHLQQVEEMQSSIHLIDMRLEGKMLNDRYSILDQRINDILIRYGPDLFEAPGPVRDQYRAMVKERDELEKEINTLQQEYRRQGNSRAGYYERYIPSRER